MIAGFICTLILSIIFGLLLSLLLELPFGNLDNRLMKIIIRPTKKVNTLLDWMKFCVFIIFDYI